jgi:alpha-ketoglutarate-dependent taurine dioxygenase
MDYFERARQLPLVIRARRPDLDLIGWTAANLPTVLSELLRHGAILFRGFPVTHLDQFRQFVVTVSGDPVPYREWTSPRTRVMENVYTSTDYPSSQRILPHNENSYAITFPQKLFFWCETAAQQGGQTPLCDTRKVFASIDQSVVNKFLQKQWMYVRNFAPHFGLSWQTAFQTNDREEVEAYCRLSRIECEWTAVGLRTRQIRPAVAQHPESGELVWFNHVAFFHISNVEPNLQEQLLAQYKGIDLPNNTYYGDGSPIEDWVVRQLLEAYEKETVSFPWEPGDVVLIDNMLTAHARAPFIGPRRILFAMAEPYTRTDMPIVRIGE